MTVKGLVALSVALAVALVFWSSAVSAEQTATGVAPVTQAVPLDPTELEMEIERRRDMLDRQRDLYWDTMSGRRWRQPPWETAWDDWSDMRRDAMREQMRQHRAAMERQFDARRRWYSPWQQWRDDVDQARRNAWDLESLAREEAVESHRYGGFHGPYGGYGPWGPFPY